jgi:hypothetical protein
VCNQNVIEDTFIKLNSSHKVEDKIINTSSVPKLMAQLYLNTDISIIKMHIDTFESGQSYDTFFLERGSKLYAYNFCRWRL